MSQIETVTRSLLIKVIWIMRAGRAQREEDILC